MAQVQLQGFRRVQLNWGETLQALAARELGDASLWVKIAEINKLAPPYVTGDPLIAGKLVALYGDTLMVPAPKTDIRPGARTAEDVFQADVALPQGRLQDANGDFSLVAGHANLKQALEHRLRTGKGELIFHGKYGCDASRLRGEKKDQANVILAKLFVDSAILSDDRISRIISSTAEAAGDTVRVEVNAMTASGHPVDLTTSVGE